ncbi:MAG: hypothetical protein HY428_01465 [Candidatus Levybacteria bacterium]|nr:hypothetical protein [Candidatus Levybacteria bacterium]
MANAENVAESEREAEFFRGLSWNHPASGKQYKNDIAECVVFFAGGIGGAITGATIIVVSQLERDIALEEACLENYGIPQCEEIHPEIVIFDPDLSNTYDNHMILTGSGAVIAVVGLVTSVYALRMGVKRGVDRLRAHGAFEQQKRSER